MVGVGGCRLVWDLETAEEFHEGERSEEYAVRAGISVAVVYDEDGDQWEFYTGGDFGNLATRLEEAGEVVSYNGVAFDHVVLDAALGRRVVIPGECDLYALIRNKLGDQRFPRGSWTLGAVCERTIGRGKLREAAHAPTLWKDGRIGELVTYCTRDVWLTRELWRFVRRYGYVIGPGGKKYEMGERIGELWQ